MLYIIYNSNIFLYIHTYTPYIWYLYHTPYVQIIYVFSLSLTYRFCLPILKLTEVYHGPDM